MVIIHATIIFLVTPHRTALNLFVAPAPMIEPVMVWVVLTGMPKILVENNVKAPAVSALNPSKDLKWVILVPIVFTILQPPIRVPVAIAIWHAMTTQKGMVSLVESLPAAIMATKIIPIAFCASFAPCPMLYAAAEIS